MFGLRGVSTCLSIEKDGYMPTERTVSGIVSRAGTLTIMPPPIRITQRLLPSQGAPPRMVFVPGGDYRLISWARPTDRRVRLNDYFIDKYEVSNQEYKEFINAGGYVNRAFWKYPVARDGRTDPMGRSDEDVRRSDWPGGAAVVVEPVGS